MEWTRTSEHAYNGVGVSIHCDYWGYPHFRYGANNSGMIEWDGRANTDDTTRTNCLKFREQFNEIGTRMNPSTFRPI